MSSLKPLIAHGKGGPNPPKVLMLLEELGLPHEVQEVPFPDLKKEPFLSINPNGRKPALHDPNTGITIWESGAILEYLVETYDTEHKISFEAGSKDGYLAKQWLFFQASGQGPYYGQAVWFTKFHPEQIESAKERYYNEIKRVTSVLEGHLAKQPRGVDGPWLVGGKFSYVDLAFVPWQHMMMVLLPGTIDLSEFTVVKDWMDRMMARKAIGNIMQDVMESMKPTSST